LSRKTGDRGCVADTEKKKYNRGCVADIRNKKIQWKMCG